MNTPDGTLVYHWRQIREEAQEPGRGQYSPKIRIYRASKLQLVLFCGMEPAILDSSTNRSAGRENS